MKAFIATPLLLLAILPAAFSLPWTGLQGFQNSPKSAIKPTGAFDGCYSDTSSQILGNSGEVFESDANINANCANTCKEKGFAIASTRGRTCYCTDAFPYPQLFPANDSRAAGKSGPCSITCPGAWTEDGCQSDECCGGESAYSVFIVDKLQVLHQQNVIMQQQQKISEPSKRYQFAHVQESGKFDGCYSDAQANVLGGVNGKMFTWDDNYNTKCQAACRGEGYPIASTKGRHCYCTNTLPIPQLYRADSDMSAGNGGPCSTVCPGVFTTHSCQKDECCGGENAASVYLVGEIDALKQLQRRVIDRVQGSSRAKSLLLGGQELKYYIKEQWKTEVSGNECQLKSGVLSQYGQIGLKHEVSSQLYKDYNNAANGISTQQQLNRQCTYERVKFTLDFKVGINVYELYSTYISFVDENSAEVYSDVFENYELTVKPGSGWSIFELDISLPQGTVGARVAGIFWGRSVSESDRLSGDICNHKHVPTEIIMETWGSCPLIENSPFGVRVIAMGQTATSEGVGSMKVYNLTNINGEETLTEIPLPQSPFRENENTDLMLTALEKLIESEEPIKEVPFTNWDIVCDNIFGVTDKFGPCDKTFTESTAFTTSWTTEIGYDLSVTVGTSFKANVLFAEVTSSLQISFGLSFTNSFTKSKTQTRAESFTAGGRPPAGTKLEIRFFKSEIPVQVKWRATLFADGYVLVNLVDPITRYPLLEEPKLLHLAQLLSYDERKLFAFGTIDYGKRATIIARKKVIDRDGNLISTNEEEKPATPPPSG